MRATHVPPALGAVLLLAACSENNELDPGTFSARLSGARTEALSGSAVGGIVFTEEGVSYTISMVDQGDELVFLTVSVDDPFTTIERADAVAGSLVVRESEGGALAGRLDFTGPLLVGQTQEGDLTASATFDAQPIAGGGRSPR